MDIWWAAAGAATFDGVNAAVLLAEAEPEIRAALERHLVGDGFAVVPADGAAEALALAERELSLIHI